MKKQSILNYIRQRRDLLSEAAANANLEANRQKEWILRDKLEEVTDILQFLENNIEG